MNNQAEKVNTDPAALGEAVLELGEVQRQLEQLAGKADDFGERLRGVGTRLGRETVLRGSGKLSQNDPLLAALTKLPDAGEVRSCVQEIRALTARAEELAATLEAAGVKLAK